MQKSTVEEIRARFEKEVDRFSDLDTGQTSTMDAPLVLDLISQAVAKCHPRAARMLDVGCGAGNFSLKVLQRLPALQVTLVDLSRPMLDRATARLKTAGCTALVALEGDIRELLLETSSFDIILAAAVLHHLRTDEEWQAVYSKLFSALKPGGSLWVFDLVESDIPAVQDILWQRYGAYLVELDGERYRDDVFAYVAVEDTPRSVPFQLDVMKRAGFSRLEVLHKQACFAAFVGCK